MKSILAIDIGTHCGWAMRTRAGHVHSGVEHFAVGRRETPGHRFVRFRAFLADQCNNSIDRLYYERVHGHGIAGIETAHLYGAFEGVLLAYCDVRAMSCTGVWVQIIKKHWTGKGNANKEAMLVEARRRGLTPEDDNECDALAILDFAVKQEDGIEAYIDEMTHAKELHVQP